MSAIKRHTLLVGNASQLGEAGEVVESIATLTDALKRVEAEPNLRVVLNSDDPTTRCEAAFLVGAADALVREGSRQNKLDALHHAGRALANLDADQLSEMSCEERVELLKHNLLQFIHQLLNYNVVQIRLLDKKTGRLTTLIDEGMTPLARDRELFASETGNGVTGFVAATGRGYLCRETDGDPHFIQGSEGARSSLTVPILFGDQVIGTFNVESPLPNAFNEQDLQFAETFGREIAQAIHTLELLSVQDRCGASSSMDAVNKAVAMPADDILAAVTSLLTTIPATESQTRDKLNQILHSVRAIKKGICDVGETVGPSVSVPPRELAKGAALRGQRILIVDNDERIRRSAHSLLERFGAIVETAPTANEAIALADNGTYDAVFMDIKPPDRGGYDTFCRLRHAQPNAKMILLAAFGYDANHTIVRAKQDGLKYVLFKPFRTDQVLDALNDPVAKPSKPPS